MHDGGGQVDVPHAFASDTRVGDLDTTAIADDALVLRSLVLAARALVVAFGPKDTFTEQPVSFGAVGAIINRLGLLDLAKAPTPMSLGLARVIFTEP